LRVARPARLLIYQPGVRRTPEFEIGAENHMCGIVGVIANVDAAPWIIEGLKQLEYRGYDSAGIAISSPDGSVVRYRAAGKLKNLEDKIQGIELAGGTGIGHTRWATHGVPSEANAHPHEAGRVYVVHNGIIENFKELRVEAASKGAVFQSETDTEVVAQLMNIELLAGKSAELAFSSVLERLHGAFALVAMVQGRKDLVMGARQGAPLAAGMGEGATFLASDPIAIARHADTIAYLEDGEYCFLRPDRIDFFNTRSGAPVDKTYKRLDFVGATVGKGNHRHFMQKEIYEQPEVVGHTLSSYLDAVSGTVRAREGVDLAAATRLLIVGCGTASYAGMVAKYWFESLSGLPVQVDIASEFRYRNPAFMPGDVALFISQSGETADTLEAMRLCKTAGLKTIALVNSPHSSMAREADIVAPTMAGPEIGVASTKAFTCQLASLASLAVLAAVQRGRMDVAEQARQVALLMSIPGLMAQSLRIEDQINRLAGELAQAPIVLYLGRNEFFPMALEGALKLKEISYIHAEGYAAGELKHGPIALIEEDVAVIVIAPHDALFVKTRSSIQEVRARGARVIAITDDRGAAELEGEASSIITLPQAEGIAAPLVAAVAVQLLAYYVAVHKGTDVDQPRNLAKSVTVE
jgi:glucosamine--fructose-6-phosphate aminotransferase (isomerizing)